MNSLVLFLGVTLLALCEARPTVHKVTSKLITHVYRFREKVTGHDGRPKDRRDKNGLGLKTNCQDGALVGVDRGLERGISGITNNAEGVISDVTLHGNLLGVAGDAVDHVGHAAQGLIDNVDHGLGNGIDDLACGIGKDADEIAEGVQTGDILGGLADVAGTTVTSVADTLGALADGAVGGVDDVLDQALDILKSL